MEFIYWPNKESRKYFVYHSEFKNLFDTCILLFIICICVQMHLHRLSMEGRGQVVGIGCFLPHSVYWEWNPGHPPFGNKQIYMEQGWGGEICIVSALTLRNAYLVEKMLIWMHVLLYITVWKFGVLVAHIVCIKNSPYVWWLWLDSGWIIYAYIFGSWGNKSILIFMS